MENEIPMYNLWAHRLMEIVKSDNDVTETINKAEEPCLMYFSPTN